MPSLGDRAMPSLGDALYRAAAAGEAGEAEALLRRGADPLAAGPEGTPLFAAVHHGHSGVADRILDWAAETGRDVGLNAVSPVNDVAPLARALHSPGLPLVRRLLEAGADPRGRCASGQFPLMYVASIQERYGYEL
jgi:hypothetical protein